MSAGSFTQPFSKKQLDLLLAEPLDVEGAARHEMPQVLGASGTGRRTRRCSASARPPRRPRLISRTTGVFSGHGHVLRKLVGLRALRPLLQHDAEHLRDHVAGALDRHGVADPHVEPRDLVSLCRVAFCTTTPPTVDRLELRDRRERAGAADLDLDVAQHASSPARPGTCARSPSAGCARRSRAAPASRAGRPCRRRRRCRSRACRAAARSRGGRRAAPRPSLHSLQQRIGRESRRLPSHFTMPDCVSAGISLISPQA